MNEKALNRSYELAVADGYVGNLEEFVKRITDDQEALDRTYLLAVRDGFDGDLTSYSTMMGLSIPEVQAKEEVTVEEVKEVEEVVDDSVVQTRSELLNVVNSEEYKNEVADLSKEVEEVKTSVELKPLLYAFQPSIATGITAAKSIIEDGFLKEYYVYDDLEKEIGRASCRERV